MTMQSKKQIENQSQSGRSMVEMLGVLAIIAVVSIGGIVGYKLAMNHYQASQIAHEMNMMRTDAQIKIAQGTENLTLGAPYDEHKINFNDYDTAFGCKYVDENDIISDETVSCQIANAYFIELPKIPDGVCQPLARLINGMDNLIAFYVNSSEYEEGGTCQEGENDLYAVFSGETVSDLTHCERDDDCDELESTTVCDLSRHVCVECTEEKGCEGESEYCEDNVCKSCDEGLVWNGTDCVECVESGDCENPTTPYCNQTSNRCEPCENDSQCDTAQNEHCTSTGECVVCEDGEEWNSEFKECVVTSCQENSDCNKNGHNHYYCHFDDTNNCSKQAGYPGRCVNKDEDVIVIEGTDFIAKMSDMSWWSAQNFCQANKKELANIVDLNCADSITPSSNGYCHQTKAGNTDYDPDNISNTVITLHATLGNHYFWLQEWYDEACPAGGVGLDTGRVDKWYVSVQYSNNFALCK